MILFLDFFYYDAIFLPQGQQQSRDIKYLRSILQESR